MINLRMFYPKVKAAWTHQRTQKRTENRVSEITFKSSDKRIEIMLDSWPQSKTETSSCVSRLSLLKKHPTHFFHSLRNTVG
jgi:hypothetical protein